MNRIYRLLYYVFIEKMVFLPPVCPRINLLQNGFHETLAFLQEEYTKDYKNFEIFEREKYYMDPPPQELSNSGLKRLKKFEHLVENGFKDKLSRFQREFMESMIKAEAEIIIGEEEWPRIGTTLIHERGWENRKKVTIGQGPRRFGKTRVLSTNNALILITIPDIIQSLYSPGKRASTTALQTVFGRLCELGATPMIVKMNHEELWVRNEEGRISKAFFYPSNEKVSVVKKVYRLLLSSKVFYYTHTINKNRIILLI